MNMTDTETRLASVNEELVQIFGTQNAVDATYHAIKINIQPTSGDPDAALLLLGERAQLLAQLRAETQGAALASPAATAAPAPEEVSERQTSG
jgi:hypothetical protein